MQKTIIPKLSKRIKMSTFCAVALFLNFSQASAQVEKEKNVKAFEFLSNSTEKDNRKALEFKKGAVVSAHPEATAVGVAILKKGGNAVDATVAVKFALAVVYPNAGNIGGGGFLIYRSEKGELNSMDFREKAPALAQKDMYLDINGNPISEKSKEGHLAAGVPGTVAGMVELHQKYGKLKWAELVEPALQLATNGFKITTQQANELNRLQSKFRQFNPLGTVFIKDEAWKEGDLLIQTELANTLKLVRDKGRAGFYEGEVANYIVEEMKRGGGLISKEDLKNYHAAWRKPITGNYKGYKVITMPPTSSGGIALIQLLQSVEPYALSKWGHNADSTVQVMVEAERRAYADRAKHLGDPDFWKVPQKELLEPAYNKGRMATLNWNKATPSTEIQAGEFAKKESEETTHFSVIDKEGNAISLTTTINTSYGNYVVVKGAGFLLNNEMDDFSVKPGTPNYFGLVGYEANAIAPNKRMLSSMTPTILEKNGKLSMVVGTPGGSTIITSVFQTIVNVIDFGMDMQQAVNAKKFHHQWLPDRVDIEPNALNPEAQQKLEAKGYTFYKRNSIGRVDAILVTKKGIYQTGADPRGDDTAGGW
ncbi:gamma-glutamyltranspeptidase / glutathione hydrolase [Pedobacter xixiisoli]|uniref:Glutathione hydrolase proenzyme n=2 Tax=Pedobacter xixiisoli TaxID=1476464 RepID=A0A286A7V8_9SPHI|nr:gamma-glutamyltransferase [Pedobacter xixiisoli]SOD17986.1 gamma-glutamyltranspeptidase / glutathione hydrolase [Pedobacter xixiisoli]